MNWMLLYPVTQEAVFMKHRWEPGAELSLWPQGPMQRGVRLISLSRNNSVYPCIVTQDVIQQVRKALLQYSEKKEKKKERKMNHSFLSTLNLSISKVYGRAGKWVADYRSILFGLNVAVNCSHVSTFQQTMSSWIYCCPHNFLSPCHQTSSLICIPCLAPRGSCICHL